jgi:hypothetical protein
MKAGRSNVKEVMGGKLQPFQDRNPADFWPSCSAGTFWENRVQPKSVSLLNKQHFMP